MTGVAVALKAGLNVRAYRLGGEEFLLLLRGRDVDAQAEFRRQAIPATAASSKFNRRLNDRLEGARPLNSPRRGSPGKRARPRNTQGHALSDFSTLGQFQCILSVNAEIPDCVLDLGVTKQDLDCANVTSCLVHHGSFRSPKGLRAVILPTQTNRSAPLIDHPGALPSRACPDFGGDLELYGASSFLLDDHGTRLNLVARDKGSDFGFHQVAAAELAVDGKIEQRLNLSSFLLGRERSALAIRSRWSAASGFQHLQNC